MGKTNPELKERAGVHTEEALSEPAQYKILMHNDHYTTMDFVVQVLETVFNKPLSEAVQIMLNIHHQGVGLCGIYTAEIAETKVGTVHFLAKQQGFPLKCSLEEL
ncbi:MAG TPA: ATP-dependent Clp protease adaptor ClpS [Thermodesulfobacteriota bacterium]|nr:ATP-dependent Clp protease adaptor ClpS [Thermodesulfobacteriota bacterium]